MSHRLSVFRPRLLRVAGAAALFLLVGLATMTVAPPTTALEKIESAYAAGDFETTGLAPRGWSVLAPSPNRAVVTSTTAISGSRSLMVEDTSATAPVVVTRKVSVTGGGTYYLAGYAFTYSGAQTFSLTYNDASGAKVGTAASTTTGATMVWSRIEVHLAAPPNARTATLTISSSNGARSKIWWDGISIIRPLVPNGGFEAPPTAGAPVPSWTAAASTGASVTVTTSQRRVGYRALMLTDATTSGSASATSALTPAFAGVGHDLSFWIRPTSGSLFVWVKWYDASRKVLSSRSYPVSKPVGAWSSYRQTVVAPYRAAYALVQLSTPLAGKASAAVDAVDMRPSPGAIESRYVTGSAGQPIDGLANSNVSEVAVIGSRPKLATLISGQPGHFQLADIQSGKVEVDRPVPGMNVGWGLAVGDDGALYFGGGGAHLWRYRPGASALDDLGAPTAKATTTWDLETGPDGRIWGVSYPASELWNFDPGRRTFTNLGSVSSAHDYARSVGVDGRYAYVGVGSTHPTIIRVDLGAPATKSSIPLPTPVVDGLVTQVDVLGRFLMVRTPSGTSPSGAPVGSERRLYDLSARSWDVSANVSVQTPSNLDRNRRFYYVTGKQVLSVDSATGTQSVVGRTTFGPGRDRFVLRTTLTGVDGDYVLIYDSAANRVNAVNLSTLQEKTFNVRFVPTPMRIKALDQGPNDTLYLGGIGGPSLAILSPATGLRTQHPSTTTGTIIGEVEGSIAHGQYQYIGTYNDGKIWRYDTSKPWADGGGNPALLATLGPSHRQDRPLAWATAGSRVFTGTVPDYGVLGGALVIIDSDSSTPRVVKEPVPDQSVVSLVGSGNVVYGGTSRWGGLGIDPTQPSAKVFAYDAATNRKLWESTPEAGVEAYGALTFGPGGSLWAAGGPVLFELDKATGRVLRKVMVYSAPPATDAVIRNAGLVYRGGLFYLSAMHRIFTIDPYTLRVSSPISKGVTLPQVAFVGDRLYYAAESELRYLAPQ